MFLLPLEAKLNTVVLVVQLILIYLSMGGVKGVGVYM